MLQIAASIKINLPIVFVILNDYVAKNSHLIKEAGFESIYVKAFNSDLQQNQTEHLRLKKTIEIKTYLGQLIEPVKKSTLLRPIREFKQKRFIATLQADLIREYEIKIDDIQNLFKDFSPQVIISSSDRVLGHLCCLLSEAKDRKIPIIIPPIAIVSGAREMAENRYRKGDVDLLTNKSVLDEEFPEQFYHTHNGEKVSFFKSWMIKPLSQLDVLPQFPWRYGESYADYVLLDNKLQKERCINDKTMPEKLKVVGDTELDELFNNWSKCTQTSIHKKTTTQKKVIIALPQLYEHGLLNFEDQWQLVNDLCLGVVQHELECTLSLHPKMPLKRYKDLENISGVYINTEPLRNILPRADIFIASNGSTTWLWAALCGIPTVLCDWSGLNYDFIEDEKLGIQIIRSKQEYPIFLSKLINNNDFFKQQQKLQLNALDSLAKFDGKASLRISKFINKLSSNN